MTDDSQEVNEHQREDVKQSEPLEPQTIETTDEIDELDMEKEVEVVNEMPTTGEVVAPEPEAVSSQPVPEAAVQPQPPAPKEESLYMIKRILYKGNRVGIITQNENGPCPLIAITNILLLKHVITIHEDRACVTFSDLVVMVGDALKERLAMRGLADDPNTQWALNEAISLLPSLEKGMDINIKYSSIKGCELGPGVACFDAFGIKLVHGWLPSEGDEHYDIVKDQSYNGLVELIINKNDESCKPESEQNADVIQKGIVAESFMNTTASQLTYGGLFALTNGLEDDIGYRDVPEAVWENLIEVDGDMVIVGSDFKPPRDFGRQANVLQAASAQHHQQQASPANNERLTQEDTDRILALQLMEQEKAAAENQRLIRRSQQQQQQQLQQQQQGRQQQQQQQQGRPPAQQQRAYNSRQDYNQRQNRLSDQQAQQEEIRRRQQEQFNRVSGQPVAGRPPQRAQAPPPKKKKADCVIS